MRMSPTKQRAKLVATYALFALPMAIIGYVLTHGIHADPLPTNAITLSTSNVSYKVGDPIKFYLGNNTAATVYVKNNCPNEPLSVYRYESGNWLQIHAAIDAATCKDQPRDFAIRPNASTPGSYDKWQSLFATPGRYEIRAQIEGSTTVLTQDFDVTQ